MVKKILIFCFFYFYFISVVCAEEKYYLLFPKPHQDYSLFYKFNTTEYFFNNFQIKNNREYVKNVTTPAEIIVESLGGLIGFFLFGGVGAFVGGFLGSQCDSSEDDTGLDCFVSTFSGVLIGASIGGLIGCPLGVYLSDKIYMRQDKWEVAHGSYWFSLLGMFAGSILFTILSSSIDSNPVVFLSLPLLISGAIVGYELSKPDFLKIKIKKRKLEVEVEDKVEGEVFIKILPSFNGLFFQLVF